jgi:hypothetical protein
MAFMRGILHKLVGVQWGIKTPSNWIKSAHAEVAFRPDVYAQHLETERWLESYAQQVSERLPQTVQPKAYTLDAETIRIFE